LSSYNTAPNRPLPSLPPGGGPQTFAAAAAAAHAASPSVTPPATQKAAAAANNGGTGNGATLTTTASSARSLSVSSLGASFNIQLPLSTQHPLAKVLFGFVGVRIPHHHHHHHHHHVDAHHHHHRVWCVQDKDAFQIDLKEGDVVTVFEKDDEKVRVLHTHHLRVIFIVSRGVCACWGGCRATDGGMANATRRRATSPVTM
jgi:anaerobic selenocysteine-containing dehydrogenase